MARLAVFASGRGSNFMAIAAALEGTVHTIEFLLCNVAGAPVLDRAREMGVPTFAISYAEEKREIVEKRIVLHLERRCVDIVALAGFMKLLTPSFLEAFKGPVINIHPTLLPKYRGVHGIDRSYASGDNELGITIMRVDAGMDTGPIILQKSFRRQPGESREHVEARIHELEHIWYPRVLVSLLDTVNNGGVP